MNNKSLYGALAIIVLLVLGAVWYEKSPGDSPDGIACTQEALLCPDGAYVGRSGPDCAFVACPNPGSFVGELQQSGSGFQLILPSPDESLNEVTYVMPLEVRVSNALRDFVGKKVIVYGEFADGSTYRVETIEDASGETLGIESIRVGETKLVGRVSVTLHEIIQDNRCPIDAICIEGGAITARVTLRSDTDTETFNMPSDEAPRPFDSFRISIVDVQPSRLSSQEINPSDYRVTFRVEPLAE